jgi:RHS repeat-associated protein
VVYHYDLRGQLIAETSASGAPIRSYLWHERPNGSSVPLAQIEHPANSALGGSNPSATERVFYFTVDALGSPRSARDEQGNELWRWASDAYGATAPSEDVDGDGQRLRVELRFPGQYFDAESGLHYNGFRHYDPGSGRYTQSDPIGVEDDVGTYGYAAANPLRWIDPQGLATVDVSLYGIGGGGGPGLRGLGSVGGGPAAGSLGGAGRAAAPAPAALPGATAPRAPAPQAAQCPPVSVVPRTRGGESPAAAAGRRAHQNYGTALGPKFDTRVTLPSGRRPDAVDWTNREVRELKPDNPRAVSRGERQVEKYRLELENVTGESWTSTVDVYRSVK